MRGKKCSQCQLPAPGYVFLIEGDDGLALMDRGFSAAERPDQRGGWLVL